SPGTLTTFDFTQSHGGTLVVGVGGTTPGTDFGQVHANGTLNLDGTLSSTLINGFTLDLLSGQQFLVLTSPFARNGTFSTVTGPTANNPTLSPAYGFNVTDGYYMRLVTVASGTTIFWVAPGGGDWDAGTNWNTGVAPVDTLSLHDVAFIPNLPG